MLAVFLACLAGGLVATVLLAVLGGVAGHSGHGLHQVHAAHATPHLPAAHSHSPIAHAGHSSAVPHGHTSAGTEHAGAEGTASAVLGWSLSWLNPLVIAGGVLCFGAGGVLGVLAIPAASVVIAVVAGIAGGLAVRSLIGAFARADAVPLSADATGAVGELSAPIRADAAGEVIYVLEGLRRSAAARSIDNVPLPRGTRVVIVRRERGVAYVSPLDPLSALDAYPPSREQPDRVGATAREGEQGPATP